MVAKCANPECSAEFRYLSQGRLFVIATGLPEDRSQADPAALGTVLQHFWLCEACCHGYIVRRAEHGVEVVRFSAPEGRSECRSSQCEAPRALWR